MPIEILSAADTLAEAGELRRLGPAFARFIASLDAAHPHLMLASLVLSELEGRGHSCLLLSDLVQDPAAMLGWSKEQWLNLAASVTPLKSAKAWADKLAASSTVWRVGDIDFDQPLVLDAERLYLRRYWRDESLVAQAIAARAQQTREIALPQVRHWLDTLFVDERRHEGPDWQKLACAIAVRGHLGIITGGPGTGKTYTVARLLALLFALAPDARQQRIAMAAPTGKAAARLKQSIDKALSELAHKVGADLPLQALAERMGPARTLHSLLGARPDTRAFSHHRGRPLEVDVLIVDEASMVHLEMMAALLDALPPSATLILLGDKDQLASVEAGAVLGDLCHDAYHGGYNAATQAYAEAACGQSIPPAFHGQAGALAQQTVMLRASRRFSGPIGALALAVNAGDFDAAQTVLRSAAPETSWIDSAKPQDLLRIAAQGYRPYLQLAAQPAAGSHEDWVRSILRSFESFRILCAVRVGEWGVQGLNSAIEQCLEHEGLLRKRGEWYAGRPVMVTRNDYATGVFNGDIGLSLADPARPDSLRVYFLEGEAVRSVLATRLRHVDTAFAMTVHKSQGSEFAHTVLVLPREGGAMIARELIYTGITRARERFTLLSGSSSIFSESIARRTQRASGLKERLP